MSRTAAISQQRSRTVATVKKSRLFAFLFLIIAAIVSIFSVAQSAIAARHAFFKQLILSEPDTLPQSPPWFLKPAERSIYRSLIESARAEHLFESESGEILRQPGLLSTALNDGHFHPINPKNQAVVEKYAGGLSKIQGYYNPSIAADMAGAAADRARDQLTRSLQPFPPSPK